MNLESRLHRLSPSLLLIGVGMESLVLLAAWLESGGMLPAFFQASARLSGRASLIFFALLLIYATLQPGFDRTKESFRVKVRLFSAFAILHGIHWCLLAVSVWMNGFDLNPARLAGGMLAYLLILGMPVLLNSEKLSVNALKALQSFYLLWVWFVFMMTYVTRLRGQSPDAGGSPEAWWPLAAGTLALMLWRVWRQVGNRPGAA
jgi:hypothetical protein